MRVRVIGLWSLRDLLHYLLQLHLLSEELSVNTGGNPSECSLQKSKTNTVFLDCAI